MDAEGNKQSCETYQVLTGEYTELSLEGPNWYVVKDTATVSSRIEVSGDVHLILTDGSTLTSTGGIHVKADNSLSIYGQSWNSMGSLNISKYDWTIAGIGGNIMEKSGKITINGGTVTDESTSGGAGIGGGRRGNGFVTITRGTIDAVSQNAYGILAGNNGNVTVSPKKGVSLHVETEAGEIAGSPFGTEEAIEAKLNGYREVHIYVENGAGGVTPKPEVPGTGDANMPWLWTVLLAVCVAVIIGIVIYSRKKKNK